MAGAKDAAFVLVAYNGPAEDLPKLAEAVPEDARKKTYFAIPGHRRHADRARAGARHAGRHVRARRGRASASCGPGSERLYEEMRLEEARPGLPVVEKILDGYRKSVRDEDLMKNVAEDAGRGRATSATRSAPSATGTPTRSSGRLRTSAR